MENIAVMTDLLESLRYAHIRVQSRNAQRLHTGVTMSRIVFFWLILMLPLANDFYGHEIGLSIEIIPETNPYSLHAELTWAN